MRLQKREDFQDLDESISNVIEEKEFAFSFQKGDKVGARSVSIVRVKGKDVDDASKKAEKDSRAKGKKLVFIRVEPGGPGYAVG
jgi:hypothetical protein